MIKLIDEWLTSMSAFLMLFMRTRDPRFFAVRAAAFFRVWL